MHSSERRSCCLLVPCADMRSDLGTEARGQQLNPGLPCGWKEPHSLNQHRCFPVCALAGSWSQEWSWDSLVGTWPWDVGVPGSISQLRQMPVLVLSFCPLQKQNQRAPASSLTFAFLGTVFFTKIMKSIILVLLKR